MTARVFLFGIALAFVVGFVMQLIFGVKLGWTSPTVGGDWTVQDLILPAIVQRAEPRA